MCACGEVVATSFPGADIGEQINAAAASSALTNGGVICVPPGNYLCATTINFDGRSGITLRGMGAPTAGAQPASAIVYTGTTGSLVSARSSFSVVLESLGLLYNSSSFTGILIDFSHGSGPNPYDSATALVHRCRIASTSNTTIQSAAVLISLDFAISSVISECHFAGAVVGIRGRAGTGSYSNAMQIVGNHFASTHVQAPIKNAGEGWLIQGNTFEALSNGSAGGYTFDTGVTSRVTAFIGNWFGDSNTTGTWIKWGGSGLTVQGNFFGGGATHLQVAGSSNFGIMVTGNLFSAYAVTGISLQDAGQPTFHQVGVTITANTFDSSGGSTAITNLDYAGHEEILVIGNSPATGTSANRFQASRFTVRADINVVKPLSGFIALRSDNGTTTPKYVEAHIRPHAGAAGILSFTEDTVSDRWVVKSPPGDPKLFFATGSAASHIDRVALTPTGGIELSGVPKFGGPSGSGSGTAALGANCPAGTLGAPYRWLTVTTDDNQTAYIPCWR